MVYSLNPLVEDVIDVWSVNVVCCMAFSVVTLTLARMRSEEYRMMITQGAAHATPHPPCVCERERYGLASIPGLLPPYRILSRTNIIT